MAAMMSHHPNLAHDCIKSMGNCDMLPFDLQTGMDVKAMYYESSVGATAQSVKPATHQQHIAPCLCFLQTRAIIAAMM